MSGTLFRTGCLRNTASIDVRCWHWLALLAKNRESIQAALDQYDSRAPNIGFVARGEVLNRSKTRKRDRKSLSGEQVLW